MPSHQRDAKGGSPKKRDAGRPKRKCKGKTRAGKACRANPLKGSDYCSAHDPVSPGFGTPEQAKAAGSKGGRPKLVRPSEIAQQLIEDNALVIQRPYWRALGYDVEQAGDGTFRLVERTEGPVKAHTTFRGDFYYGGDDLAAMQEAANQLQDRAYGKARQIAEISGPDGGPIEGREIQADLSKLTVEEREQLLSLTRKAAA